VLVGHSASLDIRNRYAQLEYMPIELEDGRKSGETSTGAERLRASPSGTNPQQGLEIARKRQAPRLFSNPGSGIAQKPW